MSKASADASLTSCTIPLGSIQIKEMTTGINWKILVPFVLTPTLALGLFIPVYLKIQVSGEVPENEILIPLGVFGTLGLWLILTVILRAKKIHFTDSRLKINRLFSLKTFEYDRSDIVTWDITGHMNQWDNYKILQFKTKDNNVHSVVSYELTKFEELCKWISKTRAPKEKIGIWNFVVAEYGISFLTAFIIIVGLLVELTLK